jgi:hypothetical protein
MPLHLILELAYDMRIGELYAFVDQARAAGVPDGAALEVESEDHRVPPPDLKIAVSPQPGPGPVLIPDTEAAEYALALGRMLAQESTPQEEQTLQGLLGRLDGNLDLSDRPG